MIYKLRLNIVAKDYIYKITTKLKSKFVYFGYVCKLARPRMCHLAGLIVNAACMLLIGCFSTFGWAEPWNRGHWS